MILCENTLAQISHKEMIHLFIVLLKVLFNNAKR